MHSTIRNYIKTKIIFSNNKLCTKDYKCNLNLPPKDVCKLYSRLGFAIVCAGHVVREQFRVLVSFNTMRAPLLLLIVLIGQAVAWDSSDFEIFDAVEEINANFYEILGVAPVSVPICGLNSHRTLAYLNLHLPLSDSHVAGDQTCLPPTLSAVASGQEHGR